MKADRKIDFEKTMKLLQGSHELLERVLAAAEDDWKLQLSHLKEASKAQDHDEIRKRIHRIKGSVQSFNFQSLVEKLQDLENAAEKKESRDWSALVSEIESELNFLRNEMLQFLKLQI